MSLIFISNSCLLNEPIYMHILISKWWVEIILSAYNKQFLFKEDKQIIYLTCTQTVETAQLYMQQQFQLPDGRQTHKIEYSTVFFPDGYGSVNYNWKPILELPL